MSTPTSTSSGLFLDVLRECAAAAPDPWLAGDYFRSRPESPEDVVFFLESLCRLRVLKVVEGTEDEPPGFVLTSLGQRLADDPSLAERFWMAEGFDLTLPDSLWKRTIRETLRTPPRPRVNRVLVWLNIAVFLITLFLAIGKDVGNEFLSMPFAPMLAAKANTIEQVLLLVGMQDRDRVMQGEWWRLITSGFVHLGLLHIIMNMMALRSLGKSNEWLWGGWRFLVLYLLSLVGGSCLALAASPRTAGASGAICGLVTAEAAWLILNRRLLPRQLVREQLRGFVMNTILLVLISLAPGVSWAGHLGGAMAGAVAAVLLHVQRFARPGFAYAAVAGLLLLPAACVAGLQQYLQHHEEPQPSPPSETDRTQLEQLKEKCYACYKAERKLNRIVLEPLLGVAVKRRDPDDVRDAIGDLDALIKQCREVSDYAEELPEFRTTDYEELRLAAQEYFQLRAAFLSRIRAAFQEGKEFRGGQQETNVTEAGERFVAAYHKAR